MSIAFSDEPGRVRGSARLLRLASDDRLVALLRQGSDAAFEVLFARHHRPLLAFCRHMLGSAEDAEDAVQHTFLAAYRDLLGSDREIRLRPWLYTIARNRCLSLLRTRQAQPLGDRQHEPCTEHLSAVVERRHELRALVGDLATLPDDQRAALVLTELGEVSHEEIALVLGCRREKVKALVFQARKTLIAYRASRETPCAEIRTQLANLRGSALRRGTLRRHLRECAGCRDFRDAVAAQRRALALILPVAPSAGLKAAVLGGGQAAGAAATAALAGGGAATGSLATKALVAVALAGGGTAAVESARDEDPRSPAASPAPAAGAEAPARPREQAVAPATRTDPRAERRAAVPDQSAATPPTRSRAVVPERRAGRPVKAKHEPGGAAEGHAPKATAPAHGEAPVAPAHGREGGAPGRPDRTGPPADRGGATPEPRGGAKPEPRSGAKPESRGGTAPEPRGGAKPDDRGGATPEPRSVQPENRGDPTPKPRGVAPEPRGTVAPELRSVAPASRGDGPEVRDVPPDQVEYRAVAPEKRGAPPEDRGATPPARADRGAG